MSSMSLPSYLMPVDPRHNAAATDRPLLPEPLPAFLMRLLAPVEAQRGAARLALVEPDGREISALLVQNGRICYVERTRTGAEATALLSQEDPEMLALVGRITRAAHGKFATFSSLVRASPEAPFDRVREFLLAHTVRGILGLAWEAAGLPLELRRTARYTGVFDPEMSFSPLEGYLKAVRALDISTPDLATSLFERLGEHYDQALLLERETDGNFYPTHWRFAKRKAAPERLSDLTSRIEALASLPAPRLLARGLASRIASYPGPAGCWLLVPQPHRQAWFHFEGNGALPRALLAVVAEMESLD